jgi:hypothetical protein
MRSFGNRALGRTFERRWEEIGGGWRKHLASLFVLFTKYYLRDETKGDEMGGACSPHAGDKKCIQNVNWKTLREKTNSETQS